jgi:hypothetical protein
MQYPICRHIKTNGTQCQAPALTDGQWCYFHSRLHQRHATYRHTEATRGYLMRGQHIQLTALEDRESIQVALSVVINALATGDLDARRANALLYGLQLASSNATKLNTEPSAHRAIRDVESTPDGLDLAEPGAVVEVIDPYAFYDDDEQEEEEEEEEEEIARWKRLALMTNPPRQPQNDSEVDPLDESRRDAPISNTLS